MRQHSESFFFFTDPQLRPQHVGPYCVAGPDAWTTISPEADTPWIPANPFPGLHPLSQHWANIHTPFHSVASPSLPAPTHPPAPLLGAINFDNFDNGFAGNQNFIGLYPSLDDATFMQPTQTLAPFAGIDNLGGGYIDPSLGAFMQPTQTLAPFAGSDNLGGGYIDPSLGAFMQPMDSIQALEPTLTAFPAPVVSDGHGVAPDITKPTCLCGIAFSRMDGLRRHIRVRNHNAARAVPAWERAGLLQAVNGQGYPCTLCDKYRGNNSFGQRDHLRQHLGVKGLHKMNKEAVDDYIRRHHGTRALGGRS
ncbi:hypothetical protein B0T16DRAFT_71622 [Cercophora newfieldiana]|uniref:C2H2-type domain-containing protein n=1 Tax=Cercophora newfieldiana TaxID=92897 RepID=A0AA39YSY5_9PEZI|nr:hypothetical protein B0T16DRAFT_71622 [Cercophora newfieldiana]